MGFMRFQKIQSTWTLGVLWLSSLGHGTRTSRRVRHDRARDRRLREEHGENVEYSIFNDRSPQKTG